MTDVASRRALLSLARHAIASGVGERAGAQPSLDETLPILAERRGAFVTITMSTRLRGCIGRVEPTVPLRALIPEIAHAAAFSDPRFPAVRRHDVPSLTIEISLLSTPVTIDDPDLVEVGRHGLVVAAGARRGLLLPQVATQYGWSREEFLAETCLKAGLGADAWRAGEVSIQTFTAEVFSEAEIG